LCADLSRIDPYAQRYLAALERCKALMADMREPQSIADMSHAS
jgi:hypothetical protein